ncbi:MAG: DUF362 domain-containing protein [Acidobacteriales bacterium]|nr:DUF362 domain-containing protein [Terriglobales bacterium]
MTPHDGSKERNSRGSSRRSVLGVVGAGVGLGGLGGWYHLGPNESGQRATVCVAKAARYDAPLADIIARGLHELGVGDHEVRDKTVLLKPNLVEPFQGHSHINTHPLMVRAAAEVFLRLGAARVLVGEGPGHRMDTLLVLEESGLGDVLHEDRIPFHDLNSDSLWTLPNKGRLTTLGKLSFPAVLRGVDLIVSMPKMKTHHWTGVTLSMKNMFGIMPGEVYGWPKNVLHYENIFKSILDICATLPPHLAIVDGIVGMEGDGPIMGDPKAAGVIVMGRNAPAVDATCCRIMGIDPVRIGYLSYASGRLGPIRESNIRQAGEAIVPLSTDFRLIDKISAHQGLRLRKN